MTLLDSLRNIKNRRYKSPEDLYRKRTRFGELNEFLRYQVINSDENRYSLPLLSNPVKGRDQLKQWQGSTDMFYEYLDDDRRAEALRRFNFMYEMVRERIEPDTKILDVGCNTGFFLEQWHKAGYTNLHGLDPSTSAVKYATQNRPFLNVTEGHFGPKQYDIECDLLVFFGSIFRVPYGNNLFDALDRAINKYALIWVQESLDDFHRDLHIGLARKGILCIEKRVVSPNYVPIGHEETEGPLIDMADDGAVTRQFHSHFLFRRIEPRK